MSLMAEEESAAQRLKPLGRGKFMARLKPCPSQTLLRQHVTRAFSPDLFVFTFCWSVAPSWYGSRLRRFGG
jgi:hypothetical protein